jgi:hypothetical protein
MLHSAKAAVRGATVVAAVVAWFVLAASPAFALWSTNPAQNLAIADRTSEQVTPKIGICPDGGCYVAWFDLAFGSYQVWMQHLDPVGNEMWPHNGILVSNHPQSTSLVDWDVIADSQGHAIVVFTDTRNGDDLDVYAYRVDPAGHMEWGPDGITLSTNNDFEVAPSVCELTDGNFAVAWPRMPDAGTGAIVVQKISPAGQLLFNPAIEIAGNTGESPAFSRIVPGDNGSMIIGFIRDIHSYTSPRHFWAQKLSSAGAPLWGSRPLVVFDAYALPMGYQPIVQADTFGGALFCWHRHDGSVYNSLVQHIDYDGMERFAHNGVAITTAGSQYNLDPTLAYDVATQESFVFWNTRNTQQSRWGINGQKLDFWGNRMWTDTGVVLQPITTTWVGLPRAVPYAGGAEVLYFYEPSSMQDQIVAWRLDSAGHSVWGSTATQVSSTLSGKSRLPVDIRADGVTIAIWEDTRGGTPDVYGQSLNPNGTLGINPASAGDAAAIMAGRIANAPNPFSNMTRILLPARASTGFDTQIRILDASGRMVRALVMGPGSGSVLWDGRDEQGASLPAGAYFYRIDGGPAAGSTGRAVLTR